MDLEALVGYLVALAVPLWLVGEYVVCSWKSESTRRVIRIGERARARRSYKASHVVAGTLSDSRGPA